MENLQLFVWPILLVSTLGRIFHVYKNGSRWEIVKWLFGMLFTGGYVLTVYEIAPWGIVLGRIAGLVFFGIILLDPQNLGNHSDH
jgi:predicted membrane protein